MAFVQSLANKFAREVDGIAVGEWYENLTAARGLFCQHGRSRHFVIMHHMMRKAASIWSKETGLGRNPADQVEVEGVLTIHVIAIYRPRNFKA